jgi:hypothetical protein
MMGATGEELTEIIGLEKGIDCSEKVFVAWTLGVGTAMFSLEALVVKPRPSELGLGRTDEATPLSDEDEDPGIDVESFWV